MTFVVTTELKIMPFLRINLNTELSEDLTCKVFIPDLKSNNFGQWQKYFLNRIRLESPI